MQNLEAEEMYRSTSIGNNNVTFMPRARYNLNNESGRLFSVSTLYSQGIRISDQSRLSKFFSIRKAIGEPASPVLRANSDDPPDDLPENLRRPIASKQRKLFFARDIQWDMRTKFCCVQFCKKNVYMDVGIFYEVGW